MPLFANMEGLTRPPATAMGGAAAAAGPSLKRNRTSAGSASGGTDDDAIIRKMAELTCINSAKIRTLENHSYLTWIIPTTSPLFVKLVETGRAYNEEAKKKEKKHTMGSPHISLAAAILEHIQEASSTPEPLSLIHI